MQALMLAAGMGRRMGKHTANHTKCMINVAGKTLLKRAVESIRLAGINKLVLVVGYKYEELMDYISSEEEFKDIKIEYVVNSDYENTNNIYSLYLARDYLKKDDTILLESDIVFEENVISELVADECPNLVVAAKYEQWMDGTVIVIDSSGCVTDFVDKEKFRYEDVDKYYKTVNIYKFSKEFFAKQYLPFLKAYLSAYGTNQYYEQVLKIFSHIGNSTLSAFRLDNTKWYEIDDAQDLDIAETMFANDDEILKKYEYHFGGYWRFPYVKDFCYLVNPYYPPVKMISQLKFAFNQLLTQYPSGMAIQRLNAESMLDIDEKYILVGNGASELINVLGKYITGTVSTFVPTFNEYIRCFSNCKIRTIQGKKYDYQFNINRILDEIEHTDNLVIINPDNPSGAFIEKTDMQRIIQKCEEQSVRLIVDESFVDFAHKSVRYSLIDNKVIEKNKKLIVIKSISKSYGVPGLRLGVMVTSDKEVQKYMNNNMAIWNINSFAEYYLQIQRLYKKSYQIACDRIVENRECFIKELSKIPGIKVFPSQANYVMCKLEKKCGYTSKQLAVVLIKRYGLLVKNLSEKKGFDEELYLRFAVKAEEDNAALINALKEILTP